MDIAKGYLAVYKTAPLSPLHKYLRKKCYKICAGRNSVSVQISGIMQERVTGSVKHLVDNL